MHNFKYLAGIDEDDSWGRKFVRRLERSFGFLVILVLVFLPVGCLVGNEDYDQVNREKTEYGSQLQTLRLANDQLNKDIGVLYNECDALNSQLSVLAALSIHDKFTEGLRRNEPTAVQSPSRPTRPPQTRPSTPPQQQSRPRVAPNPPPSRQGGGGAGQTTSRGSGGAQPGRSGGSQPSGGSGTTTPPPPPPSRSGGAIDWGM